MNLVLLITIQLIFGFLYCEAAWDGPFFIKSDAGKCIDVHGPDYYDDKNGAKVQVWDCNSGVPHQRWFYNSDTNQLRVGSPNGNCLDIHGPDYNNNGAKVQTWDCLNNVQQNFDLKMDGKYIKAKNGKCLDIHGPDKNKNGGKVQMWDCIGGLDHNRWSLIRVNYEVSSVVFDYNDAAIGDPSPLAVGKLTCDNENGGTTVKSMTFEVAKDVTHTNSFERTTGFEISIGAEFETGVPFVAEGKISTTLTSSVDFTWGEEKSTTEHYAASYDLTCAEGEIIIAEAFVWTAPIEVPYTMTLKSKGYDIYFKSYGIFSGTTSWELICDYTKIN